MSESLREFVREAKRLRALADGAERDFMEYLLNVEQQPSIWEGAGLTFAELIERAGICEATRYFAWKKGRANLDAVDGLDPIALDVKSMIALATVYKPDDIREAVARFRQWSDANETAISSSSANRIVREVKLAGVASRTRHRSLASMEAEIEKLRAKTEKLRADLKAAKKEIRTLRRQVRRSAA